MDDYCSLWEHNYICWFCNDGSSKYTPPICVIYTQAISSHTTILDDLRVKLFTLLQECQKHFQSPVMLGLAGSWIQPYSHLDFFLDKAVTCAPWVEKPHLQQSRKEDCQSYLHPIICTMDQSSQLEGLPGSIWSSGIIKEPSWGALAAKLWICQYSTITMPSNIS